MGSRTAVDWATGAPLASAFRDFIERQLQEACPWLQQGSGYVQACPMPRGRGRALHRLRHLLAACLGWVEVASSAARIGTLCQRYGGPPAIENTSQRSSSQHKTQPENVRPHQRCLQLCAVNRARSQLWSTDSPGYRQLGCEIEEIVWNYHELQSRQEAGQNYERMSVGQLSEQARVPERRVFWALATPSWSKERA